MQGDPENPPIDERMNERESRDERKFPKSKNSCPGRERGRGRFMIQLLKVIKKSSSGALTVDTAAVRLVQNFRAHLLTVVGRRVWTMTAYREDSSG